PGRSGAVTALGEDALGGVQYLRPDGTRITCRAGAPTYPYRAEPCLWGDGESGGGATHVPIGTCGCTRHHSIVSRLNAAENALRQSPGQAPSSGLQRSSTRTRCELNHLGPLRRKSTPSKTSSSPITSVKLMHCALVLISSPRLVSLSFSQKRKLPSAIGLMRSRWIPVSCV